MIPKAHITEWRGKVPWKMDYQVEQDLILSRLLVELFSDKVIGDNMFFRGGTALHKLYLSPQVRYSEDIDLVQKKLLPIGEAMSSIRRICNPILGKPGWKQSKGRVTFYYKVKSEIEPVTDLRIKIEINTREHFTVFGEYQKTFAIKSKWFSGEASIPTYTLDELLATKMKALYQRKKGRDLFDLWYGLKKGKANPENIVRAFNIYMEHQRCRVSQKLFGKNVELKIKDPDFIKDTLPILLPEIKYSPENAYNLINQQLIILL